MKALDVARVAFEKLVEVFGARTFEALKHSGPERLVRQAVDDILRDLRHDFEQAVIALRFEVMEVKTASTDLQKLVAQREASEAFERGRATGAGLDVTVMPLCAVCGHDEDDHSARGGACIHDSCEGFVKREVE